MLNLVERMTAEVNLIMSFYIDDKKMWEKSLDKLVKDNCDLEDRSCAVFFTSNQPPYKGILNVGS